MSIHVKRAYDKPDTEDGYRVLVDRFWPRGLSKSALKLDLWMREVAPSDELRNWYHHEEANWEEFQKRYFKELDGRADLIGELLEKSKRGKVTLLFASRELAHNNAAALKIYLDRKSR